MTTSPIQSEEVAEWRAFIGRSETISQYLDETSLKRFLLAVSGSVAEKLTEVPPMGHWAYFLPLFPREEIGIDGHPKRGSFMPPVRLPRRIFGGGRATFLSPLKVGLPAECEATIRDVQFKTGRTGELVLVEVERRISQEGLHCLTETQTILYRSESAPVAPVEHSPGLISRKATIWQPNSIDLFRFSAVTFNAHRIHYDRTYAFTEEHYPDLVVHGPFTASKLCLLARESGASIATFEFSARAPLFVDQPIGLLKEQQSGGATLSAIRQDGQTAMLASVTYHPEQ